MPTTITSTVTVNAAFLQEIKEDNRELRQLLDKTGEMVARPPQTMRPRQVVDLMQRLRDQLAMHFALEEAYGYFDDAVSAAPRLSAEAKELRGQHATMFMELCQIVERAEKLLYHEAPGTIWPRIGKDFAAWFQRLMQHERREVALVLTAFNDDIGVGD